MRRLAGDPPAPQSVGGRMKVVVFGLGYVGTVTAACLAAHGHDVWGVDVDGAKVDDIQGRPQPRGRAGPGRAHHPGRRGRDAARHHVLRRRAGPGRGLAGLLTGVRSTPSLVVQDSSQLNSSKVIPAACTATSTSPGPGSGTGPARKQAVPAHPGHEPATPSSSSSPPVRPPGHGWSASPPWHPIHPGRLRHPTATLWRGPPAGRFGLRNGSKPLGLTPSRSCRAAIFVRRCAHPVSNVASASSASTLRGRYPTRPCPVRGGALW